MSSEHIELISCSSKLLSHSISIPEPLQKSIHHLTTIECCMYNHNNKLIITSGHDGYVHLLNSKNFDNLFLFEQISFNKTGHKINAHDISSDSKFLLTGTSKGNVIFDLSKKDIVATPK